MSTCENALNLSTAMPSSGEPDVASWVSEIFVGMQVRSEEALGGDSTVHFSSPNYIVETYITSKDNFAVHTKHYEICLHLYTNKCTPAGIRPPLTCVQYWKYFALQVSLFCSPIVCGTAMVTSSYHRYKHCNSIIPQTTTP